MVKLGPLSFNNTVYFDQYRPGHSDDGKDSPHPDKLDYSPLRRITMRSFIMGVLVSMGGLVFGYDTGQISGFQEMPDFLRRFGQLYVDPNNPANNHYYFSKVRSGLIVGLLSIGTLLGALMAAPIADRIGRKYSITMWCIVFIVGNIIQIASFSAWEQFMIGRFVCGFCIGGLSLLVPMYQAETAPKYIRGALISTYQLFITLGIFLAAVINYGTNKDYSDSVSWRVPVGIGFAWVIILGVGILFFPETVRYDYRHGYTDRAKETMCKVYGASPNHYAIVFELEEIDAKLRAESAKGGLMSEWTGMFKAPRVGYRVALGMTLQMFQQLTGANYFFYYGTVIFSSVQISSFITQMILNGINFGVTFIGLYIVEHYGRRKSLITGSIGMFCCFLIFASVGHFALDIDHPENTPSAGIALIVFAAIFILFYATTWGPMVWAIIGELFPSRYRAKGMALSTASNWFWNFMIAFFTPFITGAIDFRYGYVFAGCNVLGGLIVYFFCMEGQGRTIEEIDTMYIEKVLPWKSSSWIPPPPEEIARIRAAAGTDDAEAAIGSIDANGLPNNNPVKDVHEAEKKEDIA